MLLRANTLIKGNSGIRPEIPQLIVALLNKRIHPYIPEKGSVGASGDLSPLSHMALVLMGEGKAEYRGRWISGRQALRLVGQDPVQFEAKEGLALNNGTQQMTSIGCLNLSDSYDLFAASEAALALSLEAIRGWIDPFDERIHKVRRHPGQSRVASDIRALVQGSKLCRTITRDEPGDGRPQDPYSFRCAPQVMGPVVDAMDYVRSTLEIEMNSATDNPLIFPEDRACLSGGNFHGSFDSREHIGAQNIRSTRLIFEQRSDSIPGWEGIETWSFEWFDGPPIHGDRFGGREQDNGSPSEQRLDPHVQQFRGLCEHGTGGGPQINQHS
jgi:histidine ammonia-lyase